MFYLIRQNTRGSPAILIRALEVLTAVANCEHEPQRVRTLHRHAGLILGDAEREIKSPADLDDARQSYSRFTIKSERGPIALKLSGA